MISARATGTHTILLVALLLAGCASPTPSGSTSPSSKPYYFSPINRDGDLDVPEPMTLNPSPAWACQTFVSGEDVLIQNLTVNLAWSPRSDAARTMRLRLDVPGDALDRTVSGPSPLPVRTEEFNVTQKQIFRFLVAMNGTSAAAAPGAGQTVEFHLGFVMRTEQPRPKETTSRWAPETTCSA